MADQKRLESTFTYSVQYIIRYKYEKKKILNCVNCG